MVCTGKVVIKRGRGGRRHFVLLASNGRVVATSETYESKESCLKGIAAVKRLSADASVIEADATPTANAGRRETSACKSAAKQ